MDSEEVVIQLGPKTYTVDATFHFSNAGKTVTLDVGFPKRGEGYGFPGISSFIRFETWVNGQKVQFVEKGGNSSIQATDQTLPELIAAIKSDQGSFYAEDSRWMVKRVTFPSAAVTTTRVRYEAAYERADGPCVNAYYIYGTGSYWNGNIGKATFTVKGVGTREKIPFAVRFSGLVSEKGEKVRVAGPRTIQLYPVKEKRVSKNTIVYEISDFKPGEKDQVIVFSGPCAEKD
jgi:hypothetical protein